MPGATRDLKNDLTRSNEVLVVAGGALDIEGLEEDVQTLSEKRVVESRKCH